MPAIYKNGNIYGGGGSSGGTDLSLVTTGEKYSSQIASTNGGLFFRTYSGGSWGNWSTIV